ncbi:MULTISPECIES: tetratricopeptide repeat protein [Thiomicrorhabdus]|uniref:Sel1 repeat family protein n=1 Tax=Thiomicrorhabdus heinhorstiae TaxID=2748010 RepID=A0ABS0BX80_9GAMM|nr:MULTISPECIES: SEL1-like repeat protein [Thiomicrorhabdus]MBF6057614.1 sel1 repeat family protein [Thiomicrorhabdus heinhorstiae]
MKRLTHWSVAAFALWCLGSAPVYASIDNGERNKQNVFTYFKQLADLGDANAQYVVGKMYHKGSIVKQNHHHAKAWFKKACANGSEMGCKSLSYYR